MTTPDATRQGASVKHTPSPWQSVRVTTNFRDGSPSVQHYEVWAADGAILGSVWPDQTGQVDCDANAQLIAEAPDMLLALQMAYRKHHLGDDSIGWDELSEKLLDTLCNVMGAAEFVAWLEEVKPYEY